MDKSEQSKKGMNSRSFLFFCINYEENIYLSIKFIGTGLKKFGECSGNIKT